jgi:hydroxymethylglutaryl-CoA reductase (NADPH)
MSSLLPARVLNMLQLLRAKSAAGDLGARLTAPNRALPKRLRARQTSNAESVATIWQHLREEAGATATAEREIADPGSVAQVEAYGHNIENFIGTVKVPVGVIGPLRVNGINANGDFFVPLATSEAALVASYGRGGDIATMAGGISAGLIGEGVLRTPAFVFDGMLQCGMFIDWIAQNAEALRAAAEATTSHGKLQSIEPFMDSDTVFLICRYSTGDASGQNMVTVATEAICAHIVEHAPLKPRYAFIEGNFSGDKKASYLGMYSGRGRKVSASVELPYDLIERVLRVSPDALVAYGRVAALGAVLSGQLGSQAHYANGLAAFYIATGQDAACVSESAVGFTRMEARDKGMFFSVTMPNILVGSVGGGTGLPSQAAALDLMGLRGNGKAAALAEVVAALCLCGEISIIAAIAAGHFTRAHAKLARQR